MALSLTSIYDPFNAFFSQKFGANADAPVTFRFSHLARAFVDSDFLAPSHPEWGPSAAVAQELLSAVVDGVPRLDDDGRTVWLNASRISDLYNDEILGPSIPFVPGDVTSNDEIQARTDAFNSVKAEGLSRWANVRALSLLEGEGIEYRPSAAVPANWWNKNDPGMWTHQSFAVKGDPTPPRQPDRTTDQLLRMKVSDNVLREVLQAHVAAPAPAAPSPVAFRPMMRLSQPTLMMARPAFAAALSVNTVQPTLMVRQGGATAVQALSTAALHDAVAPRIMTFPFRQRMEIQTVLATNAITKPVATSDATISFDYCVVNVARAWFHNGFINNQSWRIPGQDKGRLSANDGHGAPVLPIGFVALKNLQIQAAWTPEDINNLEQSVQFGPFNFDSQVVNGAIGHEGIQIVGWMLQHMPDLPPNQ